MTFPTITTQTRKLIILLSNNKTVPEAAEQLKANRRTLEHTLEVLRVACNCATTTGLVAYFLRNKSIK